MADDNLAADTAPVTEPKSFDQSVEDLSNILEDQDDAPDLPKGKAGKTEAADAESDTTDDADPEDVETDEGDGPDGSEEPEVKGGRFAPDSAKIKLDDGSMITVAELKRNNLYQRDYTKKTTELSAEREQVKARDAEVSQYAQSLNQSREFLATIMETYLPPKPEPFKGNPMDDWAGYMQHTAAKEQWEALNSAYQQIQQQRQQEDQRKQTETAKQAQERLQGEVAKLREVFPVLNDPEKAKAFWAGTERDAMKYFKITQDEVRSIGDHRIVRALRVAIQAERAREKAPQVQADVAQRPPMRGGKRVPAEAQGHRERKAMTEQLRKSGDFDVGVSLLERFSNL